MAAPGGKKKKKKGQVGGQTGAPAFSEPRVQVFSKFAGCNFQLAVRDFDNIFGLDQEAQTDLMPMQMAIQNNAGIVPMGGIETRQNIVKIFNAPDGKELTGVATLIGDDLFVACNDSTIHYGTLYDGVVSSMDRQVTQVDLNNNLGALDKIEYSGTVT